MLKIEEVRFSETSLHFFPNEQGFVPGNKSFLTTNVTGSNFRLMRSDAV